MASKLKRKINYFEIKTIGEIDTKELLKIAISRIIKANKRKSKKRYKDLSGGGGKMIINVSKEVGNHIYFFSKSIRGQFPEITDMSDDVVERLDAEDDDNKGVHEEAHFVISFKESYLQPIIAIESTLKGPKFNDIQRYLNSSIKKKESDQEFIFEPIFAFNYDEMVERVSDVANIKMMFHRDQISLYSNYDPSTGEILRASMDYLDAEYVTLEYKINFQQISKRYPTNSLVSRFHKFIDIFRKTPKAIEHITKLDVRAQDKKFNGRLRLFDLIESKVASEVLAERRRPRSQYYNSSTLYDAIREQMARDFG